MSGLGRSSVSIRSIDRIDNVSRCVSSGDIVRRNVIAAALARVQRDLEFLTITRDEYLEVADTYTSTMRRRIETQASGSFGPRELTPEENAEFEEQLRLGTILHLRIETFYFFAQRLLDHLVFAADVVFGPAAVTLGRHRSLERNLKALIAAGGAPEPPAGFWSLFDDVTERVKDYRDDFVAHTHHDRLMKSTVVQLEEGVPRIHLGIMFPREGEALDVTSEPLDVLLPVVDRWALVWLDYLERQLVRGGPGV
jgi:hypothetical protein